MNKNSIREYRIWKAIKARCSAPSARKGVYLKIEVCDEWKNSFDTFVIDMGNVPTDKHSIDRIDNSKGYYKENCRWSDAKTQCSNRGDFNVVITHNNQSKVLKDWARLLNIKYTTLYQRMFRQNMSFEQAINFKRKTFIYKDFTGSLKEIVDRYSVVPYQLVVDRMHKKWSIDKALTTKKIIMI
jgi:hypothetical protein